MCNIHVVLLFMVINGLISIQLYSHFESDFVTFTNSMTTFLSSGFGCSDKRFKSSLTKVAKSCDDFESKRPWFASLGKVLTFAGPLVFETHLWHTHFQTQGRSLDDSRFQRLICDQMTRQSMIRIILNRLCIYEMTRLHAVVAGNIFKQKFRLQILASKT